MSTVTPSPDGDARLPQETPPLPQPCRHETTPMGAQLTLYTRDQLVAYARTYGEACARAAIAGAAEPLTDEQIDAIQREWIKQGGSGPRGFARAIERAHGIGAAPSGGAGSSAECSEQRPEDATQTSEQDRPKGIPPPKMTIAGEGPDRGHWWSEDQVREIVSGETRSGASDGSALVCSFGSGASATALRSQPPTGDEVCE
jgi:hypothetical protein